MKSLLRDLPSKMLLLMVCEDGQDLVEYALVIAIVVTAAVVVLGGFGAALNASISHSTALFP